MTEALEALSLRFGISSQTILMLGIGLGIVLMFMGVVSFFGERNAIADRMAATASSRRQARQNRGLVARRCRRTSRHHEKLHSHRCRQALRAATAT